MKRGIALAFTLLAACSGGHGESVAAKPAASTGATVPAPASGTSARSAAAATAATGRSVKQENDVYEFDYSYPAAAGVIPGLRSALDADLNRQLSKLKVDATAGKEDAKAGGFPYHPYSYTQTWAVVTDLPAWLSLSSSFWSFSGGAHGNYWFGAMLWDKQANKARDPLTLFTSKQAFSAAIRKPFCAALNQQRARKRGAPVDPNSGDEFDKCINPIEQTVILGSQSKRVFDRIGILVAPYNAGPYAEGQFEVTVPVTPAVMAAVRPEYRASFAAL